MAQPKQGRSQLRPEPPACTGPGVPAAVAAVAAVAAGAAVAVAAAVVL